MTLRTAPWTPDEVDSANRWQRLRMMHPFTCANRNTSVHPIEDGDKGVLIATEKGWICKHCNYTQDWAHDFMLNLPKGVGE